MFYCKPILGTESHLFPVGKIFCVRATKSLIATAASVPTKNMKKKLPYHNKPEVTAAYHFSCKHIQVLHYYNYVYDCFHTVYCLTNCIDPHGAEVDKQSE